MVNNQIDLRWWLLSNLANIESLPILYRILVIITFSGFIFFSLSPLILVRSHTNKLQQFLLSNLIFVISLAAFVCLYYALYTLYDKTISRLAIVPVVTTVALMTFFDYVH